MVLSTENERCKALKTVEEVLAEKEVLKKQRLEIKDWAKKNLVGKTVKHPKIDGDIHFTVSGIKEFSNQPYKFELEKNDIIKNIEKIIKNSNYLGYTEHVKNPMIAKSHILEIEIKTEKNWLVVRELNTGELNFYSISDNEKIKTKLKK